MYPLPPTGHRLRAAGISGTPGSGSTQAKGVPAPWGSSSSTEAQGLLGVKLTGGDGHGHEGGKGLEEGGHLLSTMHWTYRRQNLYPTSATHLLGMD